MTTREDQIRARLEAATPGPWDANERDIVFFARNHGPAHGLTLGAVQGYVSAEEQEANLQFIAHAPEDIAYLLDEVERLSDLLQSCAEGKSRALAEVERLNALVGGLDKTEAQGT